MSLLSAQALSIVSSLQEIKMDKLRGRVRAGSRFSRDSYIPVRLADGMPGPIMGARVRGAATPLLPDKAPQTPETAESLLSHSFISRVGEGRQEKKNTEASGPRVASEALSASPQCPAALSRGFHLLSPARGGATLISMALVLHSNTLV